MKKASVYFTYYRRVFLYVLLRVTELIACVHDITMFGEYFGEFFRRPNVYLCRLFVVRMHFFFFFFVFGKGAEKFTRYSYVGLLKFEEKDRWNRINVPEFKIQCLKKWEEIKMFGWVFLGFHGIDILYSFEPCLKKIWKIFQGNLWEEITWSCKYIQ